jgi:hypothetical protein
MNNNPEFRRECEAKFVMKMPHKNEWIITQG